MGNKTFDFSSKKKDFLPKNDQIWPKTGIFGQFGPGLFSALLMGRLVVVARGLYLARHLFTLSIYIIYYPARALRALGLLLAEGAPTVGGGVGGIEVIWTKSKKTSTFFHKTFPKIKKHKLIYLQRESSVYCMF